MRILVIDDEAALRQTVRRMLESAGHEIVEATNGHTGLEAFRKQKFDAVITDILMPEKEGIETILQMRAISQSTRIVAMSGGGGAGNMDFLRMAQRLGADAALPKPFRKEQLFASLDGRRSMPSGK